MNADEQKCKAREAIEDLWAAYAKLPSIHATSRIAELIDVVVASIADAFDLNNDDE